MKGIFFIVFIFLTHQLMATSINFSSAYVDRGKTLNNGLVIQPNIEENIPSFIISLGTIISFDKLFVSSHEVHLKKQQLLSEYLYRSCLIIR